MENIPTLQWPEVEQSATGTDAVTRNIVSIQIPTENLFVLFILSWLLIHYHFDCNVIQNHVQCTLPYINICCQAFLYKHSKLKKLKCATHFVHLCSA